MNVELKNYAKSHLCLLTVRSLAVIRSSYVTMTLPKMESASCLDLRQILVPGKSEARIYQHLQKTIIL